MKNWLSSLALLVICCSLITSPAIAQDEQPAADGARMELCVRTNFTDLNRTRSITICAISGDEGTNWYLSTDGQANEELSITYAMSNVSCIEISPDNRYLAIESAAEGVSSVVVLDLRELVINKQEKALFSHNNHLAQIELVGWQNQQLLIKSNTLLTKSNSDNSPLLFDDMEQFSFDPASGQITPLTPAASNPIGHFIQQLSASERSQKFQAVEALVYLKATSALPFFQQLLAEEKDPEARRFLKRAIKELTTKDTKNTKFKN